MKGNFFNGENAIKNMLEDRVRLYRLAAEQGNAIAQYGLGCFYMAGEGVMQDYTEAMKWLEKAAAQGYEEAQYVLNDIFDIEEDDNLIDFSEYMD